MKSTTHSWTAFSSAPAPLHNSTIVLSWRSKTFVPRATWIVSGSSFVTADTSRLLSINKSIHCYKVDNNNHNNMKITDVSTNRKKKNDVLYQHFYRNSTGLKQHHPLNIMYNVRNSQLLDIHIYCRNQFSKQPSHSHNNIAYLKSCFFRMTICGQLADKYEIILFVKALVNGAT